MRTDDVGKFASGVQFGEISLTRSFENNLVRCKHYAKRDLETLLITSRCILLIVLGYTDHGRHSNSIKLAQGLGRE